MIQYLRKILCVVSIGMLAACGGDNSDTKPAENPVVVSPFVNAQPIANAGADQYVLVGSTVTLDGGASSDGNGDALTYKWSLVSKPVGSVAALAANSNVRSVFVADVAGEYAAILVVNDGKIDSLPENITIVAVPNTGVGTSNLVANGGPNQNVSVKTIVNLDGSSSTDSKGRTLSYNWTLIAKPTGSEAIISSSAGKKATFIADAAGLYSVLFYVGAGNEKSLPVTIFINASANGVGVNLAPLANAGSDQSALVGSLITLDGGLSTDPNGDLLSYRWSIDSKPALSTAILATPTSKISKFTADAAGTYELGLIVNDGKLDSRKDVINVVVRLPGVVNIPDTGRYRCSDISKDFALALFAQGHTYLDRDHDGKPCEANDILNEKAAIPTITPGPSGKQCYVSGYYRKNGTYVKGYYRSC